MAGHYSQQLPKCGKKLYILNNIAIIWELLGEIIYSNCERFGEKLEI